MIQISQGFVNQTNVAQILKPNRSDNRGGSRENAGRKPVGNVKYQRRIPAEFIPKMDEYLEKLKTAVT